MNVTDEMVLAADRAMKGKPIRKAARLDTLREGLEAALSVANNSHVPPSRNPTHPPQAEPSMEDKVRSAALAVIAQDSGNSYRVAAIEELCERMGVKL